MLCFVGESASICTSCATFSDAVPKIGFHTLLALCPAMARPYGPPACEGQEAEVAQKFHPTWPKAER